MCDKRYLKAIYATANKYGLCERNSECDDLHAIVYNLTRKASIRDLTDDEAKMVLRELQKYEPVGKGKMTDAQIRKAWAVYYRLKELTPGTASDGERICGIINKVTGISAVAKAPFKWLSMDDGEKVIEYLKRYVRSAERKNK